MRVMAVGSSRRLIAGLTIEWFLLAILAGAAIAILPPETALVALLMIVIALASLIDRRVALVALLAIAPFKALTETEIPFFQNLPIDIGQIAFFTFLAIWLMHPIAARRPLGLRWTPILAPVLLFIFAASLSLWSTLNLWDTVKELGGWVEILILIVVVTVLVQERSTAWVAAGLIVAGVVQALIGIYQFFGGSGAPHLWILDYRYFRAFGTFGQPNPFGAFEGLMLAVALGLLIGSLIDLWQLLRASGVSRHSILVPFQREERPQSVIFVLLFAATGIIAAGLLVSWSRGAWIGFMGAALMMVIFAPRRRAIGLGVAAVVLVGGAFAFTSGLVPDSLVARITDFTQEFTGFEDVRGQVITDANYAVLERLAHWQAAVGMMNDYPWLGVGFGAYEAAYPRYALMNWPMALGHAHNYYLNLLAETGVVGFSAYVIAWLAIFGLTLRVLDRQQGLNRWLALGILGAFTHLAVHSIFDKLYVDNMSLHIGVMLGLIGGLLILGRQNASTVPSTPEAERAIV